MLAGTSSCYHTTDGKCAEPLSQDSCPDDHWLVAHNSEVLRCVKMQCGQDKVLIHQNWENIFDESICPGPGEAIFLNAKAKPSCQCKHGWQRMTKDDANDAPVWKRKKRGLSSGVERCYQEFTPGFYSGNMIMKSFNGWLGCINNPCGDNLESIPHL